MSYGETQSQGWAGESLVWTGQTSCWNLWPGYHSLHPMLPAPACGSPPKLGSLSTAGQQLLQYHWWDNTPGQKTSCLLTQRAWSLTIPRLLVFPPLCTQSNTERTGELYGFPGWRCWDPLSTGQVALSTYTHVAESKFKVVLPSVDKWE